MRDIVVREKPDEISWEELANLQHRAHERNIANGVKMKIASCTAAELCNDVSDGITLVAQDVSGRLVGMASICTRTVNRWWHHGKGAYLCCMAVAPEYQNRGVYKALNKRMGEMITNQGISVAFLNTHVNNKIARHAYEKEGFRLVRFSPGGGPGYYSVEYAKWYDGRSKNKYLCKLMFLASELLVRILFKPGRVRRF